MAHVSAGILGLVAIYLIAAEFIDTIGRLELIENHWPKAWKILSNRPMRLILTLFMIGLLVEDWSARLRVQEPHLTLTIQAPPAPIVRQEEPRKKESGRIAKSTTVHGPITQTTNAPCSSNSVGGTVDLRGCNPPVSPYKPIVTYDLDGTKHIASNHDFSMDQSLILVYKQFQELAKQKKWREMLSLAESTKKTDPDWFLLDYTSGYAHLYLCESADAIRDLNKFSSESADAPAFAKPRSEVPQLLNTPSTYEYRLYCHKN